MDTLNTLLFIFSVVLILIPVFSSGASLLTYIKTKEKVYLYATLLLLTFICDLTFLHYIDFYHFSTTVLSDTFISFAPFKILLFSIMLILNMLIVLHIFKKEVKAKYFLFIPIFVAIEVILKVMPENNLMIWMFYTTRQVFSIIVLLFFYYSYVRCTSANIKKVAKKFVGVIGILILLNLIIVIEDALVSSQQEAFSTSGLIFKERNFTENLYWMVVTMLIFSNTLPVIRQLEIPAMSKSERVSQDIQAFTTSIQLTRRELEIFHLIIQHTGNSEIAEQLCISSGTLKAHIHNIYAKADVSHRNELIKKASEYSLPDDTITNEI